MKNKLFEIETVWTCGFCGTEFSTKKEADEHDWECEKNPDNDVSTWACDLCDKEFSLKREFDKHRLICTGKNQEIDINNEEIMGIPQAAGKDMMNKKMSLARADEIRIAWGKFLEVAFGGLVKLFLCDIPESVLPYPKDEIECAVNISAKEFFNSGNKEASTIIHGTTAYLTMFINDKEAIDKLLKKHSGIQETNEK